MVAGRPHGMQRWALVRAHVGQQLRRHLAELRLAWAGALACRGRPACMLTKEHDACLLRNMPEHHIYDGLQRQMDCTQAA